MIDLSRNRAELLAEIEAVEPATEAPSDLTDPRVGTADVHVQVYGHAKKDLFPLLKAALSERFAAVSRQQLIRDLLVPLRNALGNAYKHGNARNPDGVVCVEIVLTRHGALIAVTDEGSGFDVALTFRRFQEQEDYCENRGAGFRNLDRARSTVSYENGGRTLLLCFRPAIPARAQSGARALPPHEPPGSASVPLACRSPLENINSPAGRRRSQVQGPDARPKLEVGALHEPRSRRGQSGHFSVAESQRGLTSAATVDGFNAQITSWNSAPEAERRTPGRPVLSVEVKRAEREMGVAKVLDPGWIQTCLSAESLELGNGRTRIESCRVYAPGGPADDGCGIRYVLRMANRDGRPAETRILTGRLHATEAAASSDFEAARRLHDAAVSDRLRIPRPVARLTGEPRLVLYDFDPWINLWEYLTYRDCLKVLRHSAERVGRGLAHLHRSQVVFPGVERDPVGGELHGMVARAETILQNVRAGTDLVNRFRVSVQQAEDRSAFTRQQTRSPIHGAMGWDCIHYGSSGRFFLYRFEMCRQSDAGFDLGGFAADLLCFTLTHHNEETCRTSLDTFLSTYNAEAEHPMGENDLRFYIALALVERLGRAETRTRAAAGQWLAALDVALGRRGAVAASEVSP